MPNRSAAPLTTNCVFSQCKKSGRPFYYNTATGERVWQLDTSTIESYNPPPPLERPQARPPHNPPHRPAAKPHTLQQLIQHDQSYSHQFSEGALYQQRLWMLQSEQQMNKLEAQQQKTRGLMLQQDQNTRTLMLHQDKAIERQIERSSAALRAALLGPMAFQPHP